MIPRRFCFLLPVLHSLSRLPRGSAQCDVCIAIYWWQEKCVCRRRVTNGVTELCYYFVNNADSQNVKKHLVYMNSQGRVHQPIEEGIVICISSPPRPICRLHLTYLLYARIQISVTILKLKRRWSPLHFSYSVCLVYSCVTRLVLMDLCCP